MGLIYNILIGLVHLLFVVFDIIFVMILTRFIYLRWGPYRLKQIADAIEPLMSLVLWYFQRLTSGITGKKYAEKTQLALLIICLSVIRIMTASLL